MDADRDDNRDAVLQELKQKSSEELIQIAVTSDDEDNLYWDAIREVQGRATPDIFEACKQLCQSNDPKHRTVGVDTLAQFGLQERPFLDETLDIFFKLIETAKDVKVLHSIGIGLGHFWDEPRKVKPLVKLKNHSAFEVRYAVAQGLEAEEDPLAIQALIELSSDQHALVRDWATFGLAMQIDSDTPEIREALYNRVIDPDEQPDTPSEALKGLARRHDERAFELIHKYLEVGNAGTLIFEAAEQLGDSRLYPTLVKLRDDPEYGHYERECLENAITACTPMDKN